MKNKIITILLIIALAFSLASCDKLQEFFPDIDLPFLPDNEEPDEPNEPDEPDAPNEPTTPDEPNEPEEPEEPDEPEDPETPDEPDEPEVPADPVPIDMTGIKFENKTFIYDGTAKSIYITGDLPDGVSVTYLGNGKIGAGEHTVTATFSVPKGYIKPADITAVMTIERLDYDMSAISFPAANYKYDGTAKSIYITGTLPNGVTVTYENNGQTELGTYTVRAIFATSNKNYNVPAPMSAVMTIQKNNIEILGLSFKDATFTYDGREKNIYVEGNLPEGVEITYTNNKQINAGKYTVTASFTVPDEYIKPADMSATMEIKKATFNTSSIKFEDGYFLYDGTAKSIQISGQLPIGLTCSYTNNGQIAAGKYTVTAVFSSENDNYILPESLTATLTIYSESASAGLVFGDVNGRWGVTKYTGNSSLVYIPSEHGGKTVMAIATDAFRGNTSVEEVFISDTVVDIGNNAFRGCTALKSVRISESVSNIGVGAFRDCSALTNIVLPDSLKTIGEGALRGATSLKSITLPFIGGMQFVANSYNTTKTYLGFIFGATSYVQNKTEVPASLKTVTLSSKCTVIPYSAFYGCSNITAIIIDTYGLREIENAAFSGCTGLTAIYLPYSVVEVQADAHYYDSPFFNCTSLKTIYYAGKSAPAVSGKHWNSITSTTKAEVVYSATVEQFLETLK